MVSEVFAYYLFFLILLRIILLKNIVIFNFFYISKNFMKNLDTDYKLSINIIIL